jgi:hypothetical protein
MGENEATTLTLVQPTARRREWQLLRGAEPQASLRIPTFRSGARAKTPDGEIRIERRGRVRTSYALVDEATGHEVARLEPDGRRSVLQLDGLTAEWKRLGHKEGFGFVGPDGRPLLSARVRTGLFHSSGEVKVNPGLDARQALVASLLACYLLIRRSEEAAAGAAGSTAAVTS